MPYLALLTTLCCLAAGALRAQQVRPVTLAQLEQRFSKGSDTTYIVNLWATWCQPCVRELPVFDDFGAAQRQRPVKVILLSLDAPSRLNSTVKPFVKQRQLRSEVLLLNETDQQRYIDRISPEWSGSLPATLFVNTRRRLRLLQKKEFNAETLVQTFQSLK